MTDGRPWYAPPRPAWAEPSPPPPAPEPRITKRQAKRHREKANRRARLAADPGVIDEAAEEAARQRVAAQLAAIRATRADQHREAIARHFREATENRARRDWGDA
jgi:hypothetical protein